MREEDRAEVLAMMRVFYDSPALLTDVPDEVLLRNVDGCLGDSPLIEGLIIESLPDADTAAAAAGAEETAAGIAGYSMLAHSFSTEFGGPCVWIEDIYLKPGYRGAGAGSRVLAYVKEKYPEAVVTRLEVETDNVAAIAAYRKAGYKELPYTEMIRLKDNEQ